jgi:hypothetical protein
MRASLRGREELTWRVQQALALPTKKEAEMVVETVVAHRTSKCRPTFSL